MHSSDKIHLYHIGIVDNVLGPGKRMVFWLSGCPFRCKGCIEEKLQDINSGKEMEIDELITFVNNNAEKLPLTISGGEPLFQNESLLKFFSKLNKQIEIMVFSGYSYEQYKKEFTQFDDYIDILVSGSYIEQLAGNYLWRGSSNQQIVSPSGKYNHKQLGLWMRSKSAGVKMFLSGGRNFTYGIPIPGMLEKINSGLEENGILLTED